VGGEWDEMFTTNGGYCDLYFLFAKTPKGPSAFLVDAKSASLASTFDKLGYRGSVTAELYSRMLTFRRRVSSGLREKGFRICEEDAVWRRVTVGAISTGIRTGGF